MRNFPIDASRATILSTGNVSPVAAWVVMADGSRRPDPNGRQEVQEGTGLAVWSVEVAIPADVEDERDRTEIVAVTVAQNDRPDGGQWGDRLGFEGLVMQPGYVNKRSGVLTSPRWSATKCTGPVRNGRQAAAAAAPTA